MVFLNEKDALLARKEIFITVNDMYADSISVEEMSLKAKDLSL